MAPAPQLLGPDGLPIAPRALTQPIAEPQLGGVRNIVSDFVAPGMTPERLATVLRESAEGHGRDYLTLAEEMKERENHYGGVLTSRKVAVGSIEPAVETIAQSRPIPWGPADGRSVPPDPAGHKGRRATPRPTAARRVPRSPRPVEALRLFCHSGA